MKIPTLPPGILFLAGLASAASSAAPPSPPNILYILADDQSHRLIGCYAPDAPSWIRTPNIDRLAARGLRFEYAYCGAWCVPSRAMLLTGRQVHAIDGFRPEPDRELDPLRCRFWPARLRQAGYATAFIGKWHIKGYTDRGLWPRDWDHWVAWDHTLEGNGGYYAERSADGTQRLHIDDRVEQAAGYPTDNYTRHAVDFIRGKHERPWFLWLCHGAPHGPSLPAARHRDLFQNEPVPIPADVFGPRDGRPALMRDFSMFVPGEYPGDPPVFASARERSIPFVVQAQARATCAIDEGVGEIVEALRATGQLENTLIVYAADNGFPWGEHGFANKTGPYETCQRTPLIIHWPRVVQAGGVCRQLVNQLDLVPTFFAAAGVPVPWAMHGHDLSPLLRDPEATWPHPVLIEYFGDVFGADTTRPTPELVRPQHSWEPPAWWLGWREGSLHYIRWLVAGELEELYDLSTDPGEMNNLATSPAHREDLERCRRRMVDELNRTDAGLAANLPPPRS